MQTFPIIFTL